jgi:hypothetical protein
MLLASAVFFVVQAAYWWRVFGRIARCRLPAKTAEAADGELPGVSIIISAQHGYEQLPANLPAWLEQDYPRFEVVVVDDLLEDDSEWMPALCAKYRHLVWRTIRDGVSRADRKMALGVGIKAARYDWLLFTDVDCRPSGRRYLRAMQSYFTGTAELVAGYTLLADAPKWIRADHLIQALYYSGCALRKRPCMADNRNLAYRRELFFANRGFDVRVGGHLREDIVFVGKVATRANVAVAMGAATTTVAQRRCTARGWTRRRVNEWRSLRLNDHGPYYPATAESLCRLLFFASVAAAAVLCADRPALLAIPAGLVLLRLAGITAVFLRSQSRLGEKGLLLMCWLWDIAGVGYHFYLLLLAVFQRHRTRRTWTM